MAATTKASALSQGLANVFSYQSLVHAIAGATGGATAISLFFPLNTLRLRMQVDDELKGKSLSEAFKMIVAKRGIDSFYQGLHAQIVCLACSNFVYFYTYNSFKVINKVLTGERTPSAVRNLVIASAAGVINVLMTSPLWLICTQLMTMSRKEGRMPGVIEHGMVVYEKTGFWGLWQGVIPSLWLVSNPSVQFLVYERVRGMMSAWAVRRGTAISALEYFVMGAFAKAVATYVTYPLQIAQSKLRADKKTNTAKEGVNKYHRQYSGTMDCILKISQEDGIGGLYQGINAKLLQTVLTAAFQFLTYEQIQMAVFRAFGAATAVPPAMASFVEKKKE